jgi:hypothetical protein
MKKIDRHLSKTVGSGPEHVVAIIEPMQAKYKKYWDKMKDFAAINMVIDPRCKLELLEFLVMDEFGVSEAKEIVRNIKSLLYTWFTELTQAQQETNSQPNVSHENNQKKTNQPSNPEDEERERYKMFLAGKNTINTTSATAELDLYLQEPPVGIDTPKFQILNWWRDNAVRYPLLATLAKTVLMTPMTSIASESAFSTGGRVLSDFRSKMNTDTLEALVCGQDWIKVEDGLFRFDEIDDNEDDVVALSD